MLSPFCKISENSLQSVCIGCILFISFSSLETAASSQQYLFLNSIRWRRRKSTMCSVCPVIDCENVGESVTLRDWHGTNRNQPAAVRFLPTPTNYLTHQPQMECSQRRLTLAPGSYFSSFLSSKYLLDYTRNSDRLFYRQYVVSAFKLCHEIILFHWYFNYIVDTSLFHWWFATDYN